MKFDHSSHSFAEYVMLQGVLIIDTIKRSEIILVSIFVEILFVICYFTCIFILAAKLPFKIIKIRTSDEKKMDTM